MTVKDLKEIIELLIEDGKDDYTVFVDNFAGGFYEDLKIVVTDFFFFLTRLYLLLMIKIRR